MTHSTGSVRVLERQTVHISDDPPTSLGTSAGRIAMLEKRTIGTDESKEVLNRYVYSNHLQSASLELDEDAAIISYEEYHPYGTTAFQAKNAGINAVAKRYRYTGKERDEESGLYYHGARYYIPWLCRWTSTDPMESKYAGRTPYCYGANNPIFFNDPDGRQEKKAITNIPQKEKTEQQKFLEGEERTKAKFQSKLDEVANSKADEGFKKWFADIGLNGLMSFRDALYESKLKPFQEHWLSPSIYGRQSNGVIAVNIEKRTDLWNDAFKETIPTLKSVWAAQQSGSSSGISFTYFRNLTISSREEGWDAIKSAGIQVGIQWAGHFLAGGFRDLATTTKLLNRSNSHIAFGKSDGLLDFANKKGATSYHTFETIPGYSTRTFGNFEQAFYFVTKHTVRTRGTISFNLNGVNVAFAKSIKPGTGLFERLPQYGNKSLWEIGKTTEWEMSKILNNPSLLGATNFYKMGVKIPLKTILKH